MTTLGPMVASVSSIKVVTFAEQLAPVDVTIPMTQIGAEAEKL